MTANGSANESGPGGAGDGVPDDLVTPLGADEIVERLRALSRRGKLAGFEDGVEGVLCSVAAFGSPFDKSLRLHAEAGPDGGTRVRFSLKLLRKPPAFFAACLVISVWPGEPLTDSFLKTFLAFYNDWTNPANGGWLRTWMWYYPLAIPAVPLAWRGAMKKTDATASASARETAAKIALAIDARPGSDAVG